MSLSSNLGSEMDGNECFREVLKILLDQDFIDPNTTASGIAEMLISTRGDRESLSEAQKKVYDNSIKPHLSYKCSVCKAELMESVESAEEAREIDETIEGLRDLSYQELLTGYMDDQNFLCSYHRDIQERMENHSRS